MERYMTYEEREELKRKGWDAFRKAETVDGKAHALIYAISTAHYWRAREALENRKDCKKLLKKIRGEKYYAGYLLDIDHYTEHWLYAMKDHEYMKNGVYEACFQWYNPKESKYLPSGCTLYQFPNPSPTHASSDDQEDIHT